MFSCATPSAWRKPTQNWAVDQTFSTFGMPTRSFERSLPGEAAEGFLANHVRNVREGILGLLDPGLDGLHLLEVLDEPLRAGVVHDDPLPARPHRHLAPRPSLAALQRDVDEAPLAAHRAPVAHGVERRRRPVGESLDGVEPAERRPAPALRSL